METSHSKFRRTWGQHYKWPQGAESSKASSCEESTKNKAKIQTHKQKTTATKKLFLELFSAHLLGGIFSIYTPIPFSYANIIIISPWKTRKGDWSQMFTATVYHLCTVNCSIKVSNLPPKKYFPYFFFFQWLLLHLRLYFRVPIILFMLNNKPSWVQQLVSHWSIAPNVALFIITMTWWSDAKTVCSPKCCLVSQVPRNDSCVMHQPDHVFKISGALLIRWPRWLSKKKKKSVIFYSTVDWLKTTIYRITDLIVLAL